MCSYARHQGIHPGKIAINIPNKGIASVSFAVNKEIYIYTKWGLNGSNLKEGLVYQLLCLLFSDANIFFNCLDYCMNKSSCSFGPCSLMSEEVFPFCSLCVMSEMITGWLFVACWVSTPCVCAWSQDLSQFTVKLHGSISSPISWPDIFSL